MNFKTIPKNGASWRKPLVYEVELTEDDGQVDIEIYDHISAQVIGGVRLYAQGVVEVDIAPYIRSMLPKNSSLQDTSEIINISQDACRVSLRVSDVETEPRLFFREDITDLESQILSSLVEEATIANGEVIRLTAYAKEFLTVTLIRPTVAGGIKGYSHRTNGLPCEVIVPVRDAGVGMSITVMIQCDSERAVSHSYRVVKRENTAYRVAWENSRGGMECCTFPQSIQLSSQVKTIEVEEEVGWHREVVGSRSVRRLLLLGAKQREINRVLGLLLSPRLYLCCKESSMPVRLITDTITYDEHGKLRKLAFDVEEEWGGGGQICA